ncbi:DNA repair protein rad2 [Coemansia sp. RSA 1822]|nr:DNA repair protein rad2 [Coemansia sp. RSA 638]KAJ2543648.1 DNA repair protein rad2 [Coemansia sp. RSA 1853]KAJ2564974.1 DNA repair protein rad2 [Coemansia sp. RSA 1822]
MGVKGLWTLLEPAARPVRLEALTHKRLAVDASIWLYQLVKAMKDDQGNPIEDAHILGFYRRICKLLYYGIRPVFVFDGGAPELKRATIAERQAIRGTRINDAKRAAHQLLQAQLKMHAIDGLAGTESVVRTVEDGAAQSPAKKRKRDEYELPPIQSDALATRAENERDLRMAHPEDLGQLLALASRESGNVEGVDIDIDSAEFQALPPEDQHDLIVALKVKSRQTSHGRLQQMLGSSTTPLDFSKQQIDLLVKRNTLTQQWLQVTGNAHRTSSLTGADVTTGRIAGERSREYMLARSDQPGGGWTLKTGGAQPEDTHAEPAIMVDSSNADSEEFENVPPSYVAVQTASAGTEQLHGVPIANNYEHMNGNRPTTAGSVEYQSYSHTSSDDGNDVASISSDDGDMDAELMELYGECDELDLVSPEQQHQYRQRAREQREREEEAILDLSAPEFLDTWAQLVTKPILEADPHIYQSMRAWLLEESPEQLLHSVWQANRQLEKMPDVPIEEPNDNDSDDKHGTGDGRTGGSRARNEWAPLQAKVSRLSLIANFLAFVQRWRYRHSPSQNISSQNSPSQMASTPEALANVISVESENSCEEDEFETPSPQPDTESTHAQHLDNESSGDILPVEVDEDVVMGDSALLVGNEMDTSDAGSAHASGDESDDDLDTPERKHMQLLKDEQHEYERFVEKLAASATTAPSAPAPYGAMRAELQSELQALRTQVRDSRRDASGIEADMVEDIRMLLTLFGVPYVTAPMEAEAQCAALASARLVDGMVTDDSDAFLFASSRSTQVYRHFFQKDRYVEMYSAAAIHQDSSLSQTDMVFLACLLGSDYTVGVKNIGPVLAMETLAEFGPSADDSSDGETRVIEALRRFRKWCDTITEVLPGIALPEELVDTPMRRRLAQVVRKSGVPPSFPDPRVVHAYFSPQVDASDVGFEWGFPQLDMLRQFMAERLGWSAAKTDETLVPLARKMVETKDTVREQTTLDAFAVPDVRASNMYDAAGIGHSKRVGAAILSHKRRLTNRMAVSGHNGN